jgi:hypothetical protein
LRSWQAASAATATIVATASSMRRCFGCVMVNSPVRSARAGRRCGREQDSVFVHSTVQTGRSVTRRLLASKPLATD